MGVAFENQQSLELNNQGDQDAPQSGHGKLTKRWDHLISPGDVNIGRVLATLPSQFHEKKRNGFLKTNDKGGKDVPPTRTVDAAGCLAELKQRWDHSVWPGNVSVGRVLATLHLLHEKN